ncbi:MAG: alpha/beta fold hydrolase [Desulfobacteraceae bacterium]|nr:MAG: alpha/beta fold hydrolase [Desulfobacteraceae bacterium]
MPTQMINGVEIAFDTSGPPGGRPLILIMGLATSLAAWPEEFCGMLAEAGHFVIRFDNRDTGLSGKLASAGEPKLEVLMADAALGKPVQVPYTLSDMAADTLGLMDLIGIERAHICGVSMGGMIGQIMAVEHPWRLASLTSMMSTTGETDLPPSSAAVRQAMMGMPPDTREDYQDYLVKLMRTFSDDSAAFDDDLQRRMAGRIFDRGLYPQGFFRQIAAIMASGGRRRQLKSVRVPTLVIHGDHDTVFPLAHGQDTAAAIPNARLMVVPGMGHALAFPRLWPQMISAIAAHTAQSAEYAPPE